MKPLKRRYRKLSYLSRRLLEPGVTRLMLNIRPEGGDPLTEWKKAGNRISKRLKHRLPGNWRTKRGIKKRQRAIMWFR